MWPFAKTRSYAVARIADRRLLLHSRQSFVFPVGLHVGHFMLVVVWYQASMSNAFRDIFSGECDTMVYITLNDL